jgi:DNA-binding transcriptional regulator/RsmH inhibitor MraZ
MSPWVWVVGMGEALELDERGRITIPAKIRARLRGRRFAVEIADQARVVIRVVEEPSDRLQQIKAIVLKGDPRRARFDATAAKDTHGGVKE